MKSKHWNIVIISFVIALLVILFILYYLVSNLFSIQYGKRMKDTNIVELFKFNNQLFQKAVDELVNIETIMFTKESNTSYTVIINNNDKVYIDITNSPNEYVNCITLMEKLNITYLSKEYNNVEFMINSIYGLGQSIVLASDIEKYKYTHIVTKLLNIYNDWYYIETE